MWGHPGISVVDGSAVSANLGVNPALTITAQAERALALWPNSGEADPRPSQSSLLAGEGYAVLAPVAPRHPAVPGFLRAVRAGGAGAGPVPVATPRTRVSVPGATIGS